MALPVQDIVRATPTSRILHVALGDTAFPFEAGQAVMLGRPGRTLRKPYSIASSPDEARRLKHLEFLLRLDEDGTLGPHLEALAPGALVELEGPFGSFGFPDNPGGGRFLFVAGGTGIAPVRSMLKQALDGPAPATEVALAYSARSSDELAYRDELEGLRSAGRIQLLLTVTRTGDAGWPGSRGRIDRQRLSSLIEDPATLCFVCGPASLVEDVPAALRASGVPPERIRVQQW